MTKEQFYAQLQQFVHRQPFAPFVVDLRDGRRLEIKQLPVVFGDDGAGYIDPEDGALVDFSNDEVVCFGFLEQGAPA
jgi:hypothetical protein